MPADEKGFPDYLSHNGGILSVISLLCGFLFSAIAILVSNFPNLNSFQAQIVLLALTTIFDLSLYTLVDCLVMGIYFCAKVPPLTKHLRSFNSRLLLVFYSFGVSTVFLFFLWNLFYLALASATMWAVVVAFSYFSIVKPFNKFRNQQTSSDQKC